jgi:pilus assembly protein CpaB
LKLSDKISGAIERMSPRKLLLLCGLAAILVFMVIYFILSSIFSDKKEPQPQAAAMVPVIEASRDIEPQTVITEDMVKAVDVSSNLVPSGALTDKNAVVGKKAGTTILSGDVITVRKLSQKAGGFVGLIPEGMRAVSFSVNDVTGVSGFAKPGDKVDILLVTSREGVDRITSKILLKDVLILAVNKSSGQPQPQPQNTDKNGKGVPDGSAPRQTSSSTASIGTPSVVTVALTPYDAAKLIASTQIGQLQMLLRPSNDEGDHYVGYYVIPLPKAEAPQPAPQPVYAAPQPASAPAVSISSGGAPSGFSGIEVIRGTNVSRGQ